jgi:hypothetical protein
VRIHYKALIRCASGYSYSTEQRRPRPRDRFVVFGHDETRDWIGDASIVSDRRRRAGAPPR